MFEKTINQNLVSIAQAYRRATRSTWGQVSKKFYGNTQFFQLLKAGKRTVSVRVADEMLEKFRNEWPPTADWPMVGAVFMTRERI